MSRSVAGVRSQALRPTAFVGAVAALSLSATIAAPVSASPKLGARVAVTGGGILPGAWQELEVRVLPNSRDDFPENTTARITVSDARHYAPDATYTATVGRTNGRWSARAIVYVPAGAIPTARVNVFRNGRSIGGAELDNIPMAAPALRILQVQTRESHARPIDFRSKLKPAGYRLSLTEKPNTAENCVVDAADFPTDIRALDSISIVYFHPGATLTPEQSDVVNRFLARGGVILGVQGQLFFGPFDASDRRDGFSIQYNGNGALVSFASHDALVAATPEIVREIETNLAVPRRDAVSYLERESQTNWQLGQSGNYWNTRQLFDSVTRTHLLQPPPFGTIALFLGTYLFAVVPLQYFALKKLGKREWAWGVTPVLAGGFALAAYGIGASSRTPYIFHNVSTIVEMNAGSGMAEAIGSVGLYSPTRGTFSLSSPTPATGFFRPENCEAAGDFIRDGGSATELGISQWSMRVVGVRSSGLVLGDGVEADLSVGDAYRSSDGQIYRRVSGKIINKTGRTLNDVILRIGTQTVPIGTLPVNSVVANPIPVSVTIQGPMAYANGFSGTYPVDAGDVDMSATNVLGSVLGDALPMASNWGRDPLRGEAILTATCDGELLPVTVGGGSSRLDRSINQIVVHIPLIAKK